MTSPALARTRSYVATSASNLNGVVCGSPTLCGAPLVRTHSGLSGSSSSSKLSGFPTTCGMQAMSRTVSHGTGVLTRTTTGISSHSNSHGTPIVGRTLSSCSNAHGTPTVGRTLSKPLQSAEASPITMQPVGLQRTTTLERTSSSLHMLAAAPVIQRVMSPQRSEPSVQLRLPIPIRGQCAYPEIASQDEEPQPWPATYPSAPLPTAARSGTLASRAGGRGRAVPARLHALDDQTVVSRDVYDKMMKAGETARGAFGYAQHKLAFSPGGTRVLRCAAP